MKENRKDIESQYEEGFPDVLYMEYFDPTELQRVFTLEKPDEEKARKLPEYQVGSYYDHTEIQRLYLLEDLSKVLHDVFFFSVHEYCQYTYAMADIFYLKNVILSFLEDFGMFFMDIYSIDGKTKIWLRKRLDNAPEDGNVENFEFDCHVYWHGYKAATNYLNRWGNGAVGA